MFVITTKYIPATDHKGSRVSARCLGFRAMVGFDDGLGVREAHLEAVKALLKKQGWKGWVYDARGDAPQSSEFFWVLVRDWNNEKNSTLPDTLRSLVPMARVD